MAQKIVVNRCFGGFSLSWAAVLRLRELGHAAALAEEVIALNGYVFQTHLRDVARDDPLLIQVIEELGDAANGAVAKLDIVEIPDDVEWEIEEYDGWERVAEKHRTW